VLAAAWLTAAATSFLAVLSVVTAIFAIMAFRKQAKEVSDEAKMLKVQSDQLAEMRKVTESQIEVLSLQAEDLRKSLAEREREAGERHHFQAARVFITEERSAGRRDSEIPRDSFALPVLPSVEAAVHNSSEQPAYDVELRWHRGTAPEGDPELLGVIMPGLVGRRKRDFPEGTIIEHCGAVVRFTDAAEVRWLRRPDRGLIEEELPGTS
jgi:hypothetical protein